MQRAFRQAAEKNRLAACAPQKCSAGARAADRIASPRDAGYPIIYGRGGGVGRSRGVGACLGVDVGVAVGVAVVVGVGLGVAVGGGVGVGVDVGVGVGVGVGVADAGTIAYA